MPGAALDMTGDLAPSGLTLSSRPSAWVEVLVAGVGITPSAGAHIRAARAKGASEARVVFVHALRNALLPVDPPALAPRPGSAHPSACHFAARGG